MVIRKILTLVPALLFTNLVSADVGNYSKFCEKGDFSEQVRCLNSNGFKLITMSADSKNDDKLFQKGKLFKLFDLNGRDITPSKKIQDQYFAGSFPDYSFVGGKIHVFDITAEDSEILCISAVTGKKVNCPERSN
ncbi:MULTISPECIES: hypothetical protein [Deefgea]|uniref:Uncharacterized protein n=1 Tax=Deefgea chitinilytica TaxID=570276 RepID=A0ABS2CA40_9NEIS|nr:MULTISPECIES: hypothetical protein [Deefgea]MBM5570535.1 hypothetical protein [Deefgea chitinilytica]MBM9887764.1 hypothetical protein [Deefgea sp. CFH1-16]